MPISIQNIEFLKAKEQLQTKVFTRLTKRSLDILLSVLALIILLPFFLVISLLIALTSKGGVFYRQERVGRDGEPFQILKFRTMVVDADKIGTAVTVDHDPRITRIGRFLRRFRIDELPQFFNVLKGDMSIVGPRPEVAKYVQAYKDIDYIALLVKPGITCSSSLAFANEAEILNNSEDADKTYIEEILPKKCEMNNQYVLNLSVTNDIKIFIKTLLGRF